MAIEDKDIATIEAECIDSDSGVWTVEVFTYKGKFTEHVQAANKEQAIENAISIINSKN